VWAAVLFLLRGFYGFAAGEAVTALIILGLAFPALSLLLTRRVKAVPYVVARPFSESAFLLAYLAVIGAILAWGFGGVSRIPTEPAHTAILLAVKVATSVFIPAVVLLVLGGYKLRDLAPVSLTWSALKPALWMSLAVLLMQMVLGRGLQDIRKAHLPAWVIVVAAPLALAWLVIEVGIVEEFFFRTLLQERLAAMLHSPWAGLVFAALLFGLVHAPGLYLRPAATQEAIGLHPPLMLAIGYSIVLTSLAGLFLGVLWIRTKNFAVVVLVHAAGDLLPNLVPWIKAFHLAR
jgi:uncharacterized protein